jgi:hypothetical protein
MISPIKAPAAHDVFDLDDLLSPQAPDGRSTITECNGRELTWQEQQAPGLTGAFVVFRGEKLVSVTYRVEVWTDDGFDSYAQIEQWANAAKNARPPRGMKLTDLRLAALRIPQVALARLPYQELVSPGLWAYNIKFQEYRRLQLFGGAVQPPQNARQKLIVQLQGQRDGLANEATAAEAAARVKK